MTKKPDKRQKVSEQWGSSAVLRTRIVFFFFFFFSYLVLEIEPRASRMLGKCCSYILATKLFSVPKTLVKYLKFISPDIKTYSVAKVDI
jgi:hypothetical protein